MRRFLVVVWSRLLLAVTCWWRRRRLRVRALLVVVPVGVAWVFTPEWRYVAGVIVLLGIVWWWLPSEAQLRKRVNPDAMVVPLKRSGDRYANPAGSERAVQLSMDRSVMVLGETGSGKTKAIEVLAHQMQAEPDEPFVAFDYKTDYQEFFPDEKVIRLSSVDSDVTWNVFDEMRDSDDADEIAAAVFATADSSYFSDAASQVFADVLRLLRERGIRDGYAPTNADLVTFFKDSDVDDLREALEAGEYPSRKHLAEDAEASLNVQSNLEMQVQKVFRGEFAADGHFSVREYMADPQGKILILDLPVDRASSVAPIYRLCIDWSIRFGMLDERGAYYVLDEFAALPPLHMLERLVNAGRAYNCYAIIGVQDISQVNGTYGKEEAKALLSGFAQEIHLRVGSDSVGYWRARVGKELVTRGEDENERVTEESVIGTNEVQNLEAGEGVVHTTSGWQRGRLYMLEEIEGLLLPSRSRTRRAREYIALHDRVGTVRKRLGSGHGWPPLPPAEEVEAEAETVTDGGETPKQEPSDGGE